MKIVSSELDPVPHIALLGPRSYRAGRSVPETAAAMGSRLCRAEQASDDTAVPDARICRSGH